MSNISRRALLLLVTLSAAMGALVVLSNIVSSKIWGFKIGDFLFTWDAGVIVYPLTYIIGDLIVGCFGREKLNRVAITCGVINLLSFGILVLVDLLPGAPGVDNASLARALGLSIQVFFASSVAFTVGQIVNATIFTKVEKSQQKLARSIFFASVLSRIVDLAIFNFIAFLGRLSFDQLLIQIGLAYITTMILKLLFIPITAQIIKQLRRKYRLKSNHMI